MIGQWPAVPVPPYRPKSQHRGSMSTEEDKIFAWLNGTFSQVNLILKKGHFHKLLTVLLTIIFLCHAAIKKSFFHQFQER